MFIFSSQNWSPYDILDSERAAKGSLSTTDVYNGVFASGDVDPWEVCGHTWIGRRADCA